MPPIPDFIGVGAQKAGTTTVADILNSHPDIHIPACKEVHFFDEDVNFNKGLKWYKSVLTENKEQEPVVGEITPGYMYFEKVPERISEALHDKVKFIFLLRNPATRAYSHYVNRKKFGIEQLPFKEAIKKEGERIKTNFRNKKNFSYISRGRYSKQIKRYLKFFPRKNMCFVLFEDLYGPHRKREIKKLFEFLEVEPIIPERNFSSNETRVSDNQAMAKLLFNNNSALKSLRKIIVPSKALRQRLSKVLTKKPPKLNPSSRRELLQSQFKAEIEELERLLDRSLEVWND